MLSSRLALLIALAWLIGGFFFLDYVAKSDQSTSRHYFHTLGLELSGQVVGIDLAPGEHDRGVLHLRVSAATPPRLTQPRDGTFFYCVLQHTHADLLDGGLSEVKLGDSLQVSCTRDSIYYYRRGKLVKVKQLFVYTTIPTSISGCVDVR